MEIGFIGLGNMGAPMAKNLAEAGHRVIGFDAAGITVPGVENALSAVQAAADRDAVITMLPNGEILSSVYDEVVPVGMPGSVFIDCSTVDVNSARKAAELAEAHGLRAVDAPVSGGVTGADQGTLTFMAGGKEAAFHAAKPLFDVMGQKAVHCGTSGSGQAAKICNNMILGISMIGVCEAFSLADKLGLDRQAMFDVVSTSSGACWSVNTYCPAPGVGPKSPSDNDYSPGFATSLMLKDLNLSQQTAEEVAAATPLGALAAELYTEFAAESPGNPDFSAMLPWIVARQRNTG